MGLAASQARFLAITARKANCEFQSMQIAQDKLSVTRDLAEISQDYQNAINETTLVWDYDGTGENMFNLSYGLLMTPTAMNNFNPYLITTRTGSVVLNGQMAKAAEAISEFGEPVARSAAGFAKFLEAMGASGVIPYSSVESIRNVTDWHYKYTNADGEEVEAVNLTADEIQDNGAILNGAYNNGYNKDAGYGAEPMNKNSAIANNVLGLAYRLDEVADLKISDYITGNIYVNGSEVTGDALKDITLSDILTSDVSIVQTYPDGKHTEGDTGDGYTVGEITGLGVGKDDGLFTQIVNALTSILGTDAVAKDALMRAEIVTIDQFNDIKKLTGKKQSESNVKNSLNSNSEKYNQIVFYQNQKDKYNSGTGVNLSNLVGYLLTQFENILNGYDSGYFAGPTRNSSNFVTDDLNYNYIMGDEDAVTDDVLLKADFYMQLYNNICVNGWTKSDKIDIDEEYLEQMLKNGNYFISSLNGDGFFYQGRYNEADCVVEIKDHDAIAQAEAEFTSKKARLTYKEEQLDVSMKNLDAEISSLTTEYDSVKNLISKNVEKVFQMFQ